MNEKYIPKSKIKVPKFKGVKGPGNHLWDMTRLETIDQTCGAPEGTFTAYCKAQEAALSTAEAQRKAWLGFGERIKNGDV